MDTRPLTAGVASLGAATMLMLVLVGCTAPSTSEPAELSITPEVSSGSSPTLPPEDLAVAQAMEVLTSYNEVALEIASDYSVDASLLASFMTEEGVDAKRAFQDSLRARQLRLTGGSVYSNPQVQEYDRSEGHLVLLVCEDIRGIRMLDSDNVDVTPSGRDEFQTLRVPFVQTEEGLRMEGSFIWDGASVC